MQLAARLPLLPRVRERDAPAALHDARSFRAEGPNEGGTSHLHNEVRIDVHAIDGYGALFANAEDIAKAFGGWVGRHPGPTTMLQYPSPMCRLTWAVTHVIGLHVKLTILGECDVALMTILGTLMFNIVLTVDARAH